MLILSEVTNSDRDKTERSRSLFQMTELSKKHYNRALIMDGNFSSYFCATNHYKLRDTYYAQFLQVKNWNWQCGDGLSFFHNVLHPL